MTDLFDDSNKPTNTQDGEPSEKQNSGTSMEDLLASIKNDKGEQKYADVDSALKALKESQEFIPTLLSEKSEVQKQLEQMQEELTKRKTLEELTETLKSKPATQEPDKTNQTAPNGVKAEDIEKLLETKLSERDQAQKQRDNLQSVVSALSSKYGDKAQDHIRQTAEQVGSTLEELKALAASNPKLALRLLDVDGSKPSPSPTNPTRQSQPNATPNDELPKWEKGAARGGFTDKQLRDRWKEVGSHTYKRLGVET